MPASRIKRCKEDDVIIWEEVIHSEMYKILSGKVALYFHYGQEDEYLIGAMGEGRCFGEFSFLSNKPELYTVVCITDVDLLVVSEDDFEEFIVRNHVNVMMIMKEMASLCYAMRANVHMLVQDMEAMSGEMEVMSGDMERMSEQIRQLTEEKQQRLSEEKESVTSAVHDKEAGRETETKGSDPSRIDTIKSTPIDVKSKIRQYAINMWEASSGKYQWR